MRDAGGCRTRRAATSTSRTPPPENAYAESHQTHRREHPVSRTKAQGKPARVDSPWSDKKISVTRTVSIAGTDRSVLDPEKSVEHVHAAGERELSCAAGHDADPCLRVCGERLPDPELGQHHFIAAGVGLPPVEHEGQGDVFLRHDHFGIVPAGDDDCRLLLGRAGGRGRRARGPPFPPEEEEIEEQKKGRAGQNRGDPVGRPGNGGNHARLRRARRRLFATTETEDAAIAAEASSGERRQPVNGYSTPAATGIPTTL